jgi:hypothetical protein
MTNIIFQEKIEPTTLQRIVEFLRNEKVRFKVQENDNIAIDWSGDYSTYQMAMPTLARDWDTAGDDIWNDL